MTSSITPSLVDDPSVGRFNGSRENAITRKSRLIASTMSRIVFHLRPCACEKKSGVNGISRVRLYPVIAADRSFYKWNLLSHVLIWYLLEMRYLEYYIRSICLWWPPSKSVMVYYNLFWSAESLLRLLCAKYFCCSLCCMQLFLAKSNLRAWCWCLSQSLWWHATKHYFYPYNSLLVWPVMRMYVQLSPLKLLNLLANLLPSASPILSC